MSLPTHHLPQQQKPQQRWAGGSNSATTITAISNSRMGLGQVFLFRLHQENIKMLSHTYLYLVALILKIRKISKISDIFYYFGFKYYVIKKYKWFVLIFNSSHCSPLLHSSHFLHPSTQPPKGAQHSHTSSATSPLMFPGAAGMDTRMGDRGLEMQSISSCWCVFFFLKKIFFFFSSRLPLRELWYQLYTTITNGRQTIIKAL